MFRRALLIACAATCMAGAAGAQERALQDPMRPLARPSAGGAPAAARGPQLTGIFISANRRVAVIDGALHREGDAVGGRTLDRIDADSVSLRRGNEAVVIHLSTEGNQAATNSGDSRP